MMKCYLHNPIYALVFLLVGFTSCNGQNQTQSVTGSVSELTTTSTGQPKIIKPQGTHQADNIHCGLQDKAGNLWFCTTGEGVYRYDGKSFTNFTEKDGLSNNTVWSVLEDKTGNLWFGTGDGVCRYDGKTFTGIPIALTIGSNLLTYTSLNNDPSAKIEVWSIMQDKTGKLWFGTSDGVYSYDGKFFTRFLDNPAIINKDSVQLKWIDCILEDKDGNIWFASGPSSPEGVCRYDGKSLTNFKPNGDGWVRSIIEDKNGNLLFVTRHQGVCRFDGKTFTNITEKEGLDNWSVTSILEDKAGNLWFGEETDSDEDGYHGGLWHYDGKSYTKFTTKDGLSNNGVWCMVEDRAGNIWVGSRNNGLSRYDGKTFTNFTE